MTTFLPKNMDENNSSKFEKVLKKFVEQHKRNPNVVGIFVSGSFIHSKPDKNSDLDVYVVLKESKFRERGNTWIDGVEVEYFINPISQVKNYFKTEVGEKAPSTAHMFANSMVLYKKGDALDDLIKEAKQIIAKPAPKMKKFDIEFAKYSIDDMTKDLEDTYLNRDFFAFNLIAHEILERSLQIFLKFNGVRREKTKRLKKQIAELDRNFDKLFSSAVNESVMEKRFGYMIKLVDYVENMMGGKRPKEWKLKSKCTT